MYIHVTSVLATAFENCPDISKVDWENVSGIGHFSPDIGQFCTDFFRWRTVIASSVLYVYVHVRSNNLSHLEPEAG